VSKTDKIPDEEEFWGEVLKGENSQYRRRVKECTPYNGMGDLGIGLYLTEKERKARSRIRGLEILPEHSASQYLADIKGSYKIAGLIASCIRLIDDILDGHSCEAMEKEKKPEFRDKFVESVDSGRVGKRPQHELIKPAYRSGRILNKVLECDGVDEEIKELVLERIESMGARIVEEDKTNIEDYKEATRADSAGYTKLMIDMMQVLPTFNPEYDFYDAAHDFGILYGVNDDLLDEDINVPKEKLKELHRETVKNLSEHRGILFNGASKLGRYPSFYYLMLKIGKIQKSMS
jgi:hypothetical protein